jgi:hypothetical protein
MTVDAAAQRLEDEGCRRVVFDGATASDDDWYGRTDGGDWHLGCTFVPPAASPRGVSPAVTMPDSPADLGPSPEGVTGVRRG